MSLEPQPASPKPQQVIDLTGNGDGRYVEIRTDGGLVRVNVDLVDTITGVPVVTVEVEPRHDLDALTQSTWRRAGVRLTPRNGGQRS